MKLQFTGARTRAFSIKGPVTGEKYAVPDPTEPIEVDAKDADALIKEGQWERAKAVPKAASEEKSEDKSKA
ncbi:MAG: hypothetical protein K8I30_09545 [Anaerolineae bacterium]|nr:hypothetical protein [Anaerolineae bacterium]